jgi:hypothetical protein
MSRCLICKHEFITEPLNVDESRQAHSSCIEHLQEEGWTTEEIDELLRQRKRDEA